MSYKLRWDPRCMNTTIPRLDPDQIKQVSGGVLVVRYVECVRRLERMPDARWLYKRATEYGDELYRRMRLGLLSDQLCGLVVHNWPGPWGSPSCCDCAS